ncbi:hypothetical protein [Roseovarius arcticus]|uniref:hypothetical protein n=1 Tax=Roseovarius arcticus TaxID=2547404 RepID=UPI00111047B9|nr:hypothetical protein [Roseovarius arcticus]
MTTKHVLDGFDMAPATLEREWVVTIDTPTGGVEPVLIALGKELPLTQGPYDNCMFVRENGYQRFRALEGSHAGAEGTIQKTAAQQIVFSLPCDPDLLRRAFDVIFSVHVNEEPTIRVEEVWGSRSKLLDDKDNPNRYWNRPDAAELHGDAE